MVEGVGLRRKEWVLEWDWSSDSKSSNREELGLWLMASLASGTERGHEGGWWGLRAHP